MSTATSYPLIPGFSSHHAILLRKMGWLTGLLRLLRAFRDGTFVPKSTASNPLIRGFSSRHAILLRKMGWLTGLLRLLRAFRDGTFVPKSTTSNPLIRGFSSRHAILLRKMGWLTGFEPATLGTTSRCSNQLSYSHHLEKYACRTLLMKSRYALPVCTLVNSALKEIYLF